MKRKWINVPRKPLKVLLDDYGNFATNAIFMRQKVMSRGKSVFVAESDLSELLDRIPGRIPGDADKARNQLLRFVNT